MRILLVGLLALSACGPARPPRPPVVGTAGAGGPVSVDPGPTPETVTAPERLESAHRIPDQETWRRLAARPASAVVARTEIVKFLVDLEDERRLWFVDTERWDIHYSFARDRLHSASHPVESHAAFNAREYRSDTRRFELGTLTHYLDTDLWTLELISGDTLPGERIVGLFEQLRGAVFFGEAMRFRPLSPVHDASIAAVQDRLPLITAEEVFAGVVFQPLTLGTACGTLRLVRGALEAGSVRPDQILVLEHLPDEIPVVSGIVSAELQAPLGHIAVLSANRGTPNMGLRGALSASELSALDGQLVRLTVGAQEWSVRAAERAECEASWASLRPSAPLVPNLDAGEARLRQVCDVRLEDADSVGAKAAQLGEVCSLRGDVRTPGGFTIPFHHYLAHLEASGAGRLVDALLGDGALRADPDRRHAALDAIRVAVEGAEVDPALLRDVRRRVRELDADARWIFRSSTNAEDLAGFTGAGLYRSIVVPAGASEAEVEAAIRQVWASVWLLGAFEERDWYRVDHARVAMGILAQPFVDGAAVNGVAITANPFYEGRPGYFVNAQVLGGSVTGAAGDEVPEQHLVYTYTEVVESELVTRSSRTDGLVLGERDLLALTAVFTRLHCHFLGPSWGARGSGCTRRWAEPANAVDVEFLLAGEDRHVVILQARPYSVVYDDGREWR
jgi:hypothetical protein